MKIKLDSVRIRHYPDPSLRKKAVDVKDFNADLADLAAKMVKIMRELKGVGLAAPQVGLALRMFVMNHTGEPEDDLVMINPQLTELEGSVDDEEGCLSLPGVTVTMKRAKRCVLVARTLAGETAEYEGEDLVARIWQHEIDHLDGVLIIDRMGPSDRIANKKAIQTLESGDKKK